MSNGRRHVGAALLVAMLLAGCGGADTASVSSEPSRDAATAGVAPTTRPTVGSAAPVAEMLESADGRLTAQLPAGGPAVTIGPVDSSLEVGDEVEVLLAYDLGPAGAVFDPPLEVHIAMTDDEIAPGIAVVHMLGNGTLEAPPMTRADGGIAFELSSFSSVWVLRDTESIGTPVLVRLPNEAFVGERFGEVNVVLRDEFELTGPIVFDGSQFECTGVGEAVIEYHGDFGFDLDPWFTMDVFLLVDFRRYDIVQPVDCKSLAMPLDPDVRCLGPSGGEASGCPTAADLGATASVVDGALSVSVNAIVEHDFSFLLQQGTTDDLRILQIGADQLVAFAGPLVSPYTPEGDVPGVTTDGTTITFGPIVLGEAPGRGVIAVVPGGTAADGTTFEPADAPLVDFSIVVSTPDGNEGLYFLDPTEGFEQILP
jgi:hypothetical protein